ncbi:putative E3 ubiquitin protein ligase, partial [Pseudolycoriella hygida]
MLLNSQLVKENKMFNFDGNYRRVPIQNLGGTSHNSDRETLIRKSQQERQRRAEIRKQNDGAITIQSYARSFILRQRIKQEQRKIFDDSMSRQVQGEEYLEFLLKRILFFYYHKNQRDGERLLLKIFQQDLYNSDEFFILLDDFLNCTKEKNALDDIITLGFSRFMGNVIVFHDISV